LRAGLCDMNAIRSGAIVLGEIYESRRFFNRRTFGMERISNAPWPVYVLKLFERWMCVEEVLG
jgi:hypothetical protein